MNELKLRIAKIFRYFSFILLFAIVAGCKGTNATGYGREFMGERALYDIEEQLTFGPRYSGSEGHALMIEWLVASLKEYGWQVEIQELEYAGQKIRNVIAKRGNGMDWLILGAHYDTRMFADQDPETGNHTKPVMGANDGASGVSVLLEIARVLPDELDKQIWLVFFDAEDNGHLPGWDWILGSRAFVENLVDQPQAAVIVDMVGDADLELYYEQNSDEQLSRQIWQQAENLGYGQIFIPEVKYAMLDDHTPFLEAGIPAIDIIDFDYPYWHTTSDNLDKVSAASLDAVGDTLLQWILSE